MGERMKEESFFSEERNKIYIYRFNRKPSPHQLPLDQNAIKFNPLKELKYYEIKM